MFIPEVRYLEVAPNFSFRVLFRLPGLDQIVNWTERLLGEVEGEQNGPPQNMPLWHKDYFKLIIFKKLQHRRSSENLVEVVHFINNMHSYKGKCPFISLSPSLYQEEKDH